MTNEVVQNSLEIYESPVVLKHTILCRLCGGKTCKRCSKTAWLKCHDCAFNGLHSNWVTHDILAMARPNDSAFDDPEFKLLEAWQNAGITAVFNLTECGEHPYCGDGLLENGFTYIPERVMAANIRYFNFGWKDLTSPPLEVVYSVINIAVAEIKAKGKVAVHCHAGKGRTGLIAACILIALGEADSGQAAIAMVRAKRKGSVQTAHQRACVMNFYESWSESLETQSVMSATTMSDFASPEKSGLDVSWDEERLASPVKGNQKPPEEGEEEV